MRRYLGRNGLDRTVCLSVGSCTLTLSQRRTHDVQATPCHSYGRARRSYTARGYMPKEAHRIPESEVSASARQTNEQPKALRSEIGALQPVSALPGIGDNSNSSHLIAVDHPHASFIEARIALGPIDEIIVIGGGQ